MTSRTSITKLQRETAAAAELISLCQTFTEDGHLADEEIAGLRQWLTDHRGSDLPAIAFLLKTVDEILADGKVTPDERRDLYLAIEKVLPPDIRESVRGTRTSAEREAKEMSRPQKELVQERARRARDQTLPTGRTGTAATPSRFACRTGCSAGSSRRSTPSTWHGCWTRAIDIGPMSRRSWARAARRFP